MAICNRCDSSDVTVYRSDSVNEEDRDLDHLMSHLSDGFPDMKEPPNKLRMELFLKYYFNKHVPGVVFE